MKKQEMVELECRSWAAKGVRINYELRDGRKGYKAGALKKGMDRSYVQQCQFLAIFDSDFRPEPDFLLRTVPFLVHNPGVALVQARWEFVNYKECLLTRIQKISLDYHFKVEQEAGSFAHGFFGFNGNAGVWRISALNDAGGGGDKTTMEDMDLVMRACLKGWRFIYLGDVKGTIDGRPKLEEHEDALSRFKHRIYMAEIGWGVFIMICASYNLAISRNYHYVHMYMQASAFFIVGLGFVGKDMQNH